MRKTRSDSKLLNLPEEAQMQIAEWLLDGMPYHKAKELTEKPVAEGGFATSVSLSAFSSFWQEVCVPALHARRARNLETAREIEEQIEAHPGSWDRPTIDALKQKAWELANQPGGNPKDVKALFTLVLKSRDQELDERKIRLQEKRLELAEAAEDLAKDEGLTSQEKESRLKAIFGIGG